MNWNLWLFSLRFSPIPAFLGLCSSLSHKDLCMDTSGIPSQPQLLLWPPALCRFQPSSGATWWHLVRLTRSSDTLEWSIHGLSQLSHTQQLAEGVSAQGPTLIKGGWDPVDKYVLLSIPWADSSEAHFIRHLEVPVVSSPSDL